MQASSSWGRYQGYPYLNPPVNDAPTANAHKIPLWTNLPRRQISGVSSRQPAPSRSERVEEPSSSTSVTLPQKQEPDENPVVYIDLPEDDGGSDVTEHREERQELDRLKIAKPDVQPVVYIDLPEDDGGSDVTEHREERREENRLKRERENREPLAGSSRQQLPFKPEPNEAPVVYIDLPEDGESDVSQRDETGPQYVQETIFFDPFENRRIDIAKPTNTVRSNNSWNSGSDVDSIDTPVRIPPPRPQRPRILELSGSSVSGSTATPPISLISSPGSDSYTRPIPDTSLPTLPISGFPEPPPAYTEFDISTPTPTPTVVEQPRPQPTRTQVILPQPPIGIPNLDRKYLKCHHCGMQVHTLVVKEVGLFTHICALLCLLICMLPFVFLIYYVDFLKNKNHFCPNCNKIIAYELPMNTKKVVYVT